MLFEIPPFGRNLNPYQYRYTHGPAPSTSRSCIAPGELISRDPTAPQLATAAQQQSRHGQLARLAVVKGVYIHPVGPRAWERMLLIKRFTEGSGSRNALAAAARSIITGPALATRALAQGPRLAACIVSSGALCVSTRARSLLPDEETNGSFRPIAHRAGRCCPVQRIAGKDAGPDRPRALPSLDYGLYNAGILCRAARGY